MKPQIRHRRLHAFYTSKVLNVLMMVIIISLLLMDYLKTLLLPAICGTLALIFFIGYSLWLWIKKPSSIVINEWLSDVSGLFTLYFLIVMAMDSPNQWWYIVPIALAVGIVFILLVSNRDKKFEIEQDTLTE